MKMKHRWILFFYFITLYLHGTNGCVITGVPNWSLPENARILDSHNGVIYQRNTTGIEGITGVTFREGLNGGPYVSASLVNSELVIATNNNYENYENVETAQSIGFNINFRCIDGSTRILVFSVDITDTNNHYPEFKPSSNYEYTIAPPVPPNFAITTCLSDIVARDVDLTTETIQFTLEGSTLFEIANDNSNPVPKEFKALLRTTTFIRSIPEPITLTITATDVDKTGDNPKTTTATVKISADSEFSLPDDLIFSQPFYMATYTSEHDIVLQDSIYLRQGYDSQVNFTLEGQFSENFRLITNDNRISFEVLTELNLEGLNQKEIYLTVRASRELTSGADTAVILQLPEAIVLSFEKTSYSGTLEEDIVNVEDIILNFSHDLNVTFSLSGPYAEYFAATRESNIVTIRLIDDFPESIVMENNFLVLTLSAAASNAVTASTSILLEIIKLDYVTPIFSQNIYSGMYLTDSNVNFQDITLLQGYDETVNYKLIGDHANFFSFETASSKVTLSLNSSIPEALIFNEKMLLFNIVAEKPRTVGANTAVALKFPRELTEPTILKFTKNVYNGILENGKLTVDDVILTSTYTPAINFILTEDFNQNFIISSANNIVTVALSSNASMEELEKNKFVVLEIEATRERAIPVTTTVVIDIPEVKIIFPVFEKTFYEGSYTKDSGLNFAEKISLQVGYDSSVTFSLEGASSQWFSLTQNESSSVTLIVNPINPLPDDIIEENNYLLFTVVANKPDTIGGRAAIHIDLPKEMKEPIILRFEQNNYIGRIENGSLQLEEIRLLDIDASSVDLKITGDFASYFETVQESRVITIRLLDIPEEVIENNNFIILDMEALQPNAIKGHVTVILEIVKKPEQEIISPKFEYAYYSGQYTLQGLIFSGTIKLIQGFDEAVSFQLDGDDSQWFNLVKNEENSFSLSLKVENLFVVTEKNVLIFNVVANKGNSDSARAAVVISLEESVTNEAFDKVLYSGNLENGVVSHETITLSEYSGSTVQITGAHSSLFEATLSNGVVTVRLASSTSALPTDLSHIALTLQAGRASAVLLLDVTDSGSVTNEAFDKVLYSGNLENGVVSHETITLSGYSGSTIQITGAHSSLFEATLSNGVVTVRLASSTSALPTDLSHIALTLQAGRASAVLLLDVTDSGSVTNEAFDKEFYSGNLDNDVVTHETIMLSGYSGSSVQITGAHSSLFEATLSNGVVTVRLASSTSALPTGVLHIALTLQAGRASAVLLLDVTDSGSVTNEAFDKVLYSGNLQNGVVSHETITLSGYSGSTIQITGAHSSLFEATLSNGVVTVCLASSTSALPTGLLHIALTLQAGRASAVLLLDVTDSGAVTNEAFDKVLYSGNLENGVVTHEPIALSGYSGTSVQITGAHSSLFEATLSNGVVTVRLASSTSALPTDLSHIALTLQAGRANAVLLLDLNDSESITIEAFDKIQYSGKLESGVVTHETITLSGYSGTSVQIAGAHGSLFEATLLNGAVTVRVASSTSALPTGLTQIPLILVAGRASAVLILDVTDSGSVTNEAFDKVLYSGNLDNGVVTHEPIALSGYSGTSVQITGGHSSLFEATLSNGVVTVRLASSTSALPTDLSHIALTLQAGRASAVLLLDVSNTGDPDLPTVTFSKSSYYLWVDVDQTGVVGRVEATANNNEAILYSLQIDNDNLRQFISINSGGEILLSDVIQPGVYSLIVIATTQNSQANAAASVLLRVEAVPECGSDIALPPLIIIERDEETPHRNLVVFNETNYKNCRYSLSSGWPADQSWLYVDDEGLHARAIDREDESIAFMSLSQIQVELMLHCDSDEVSVARRSLYTDRLELGSDNYESNRWILANTIDYNARRSFVNLIVRDVNDNDPIFRGKENEPIYVGFPLPELEEWILPRALIELKATDADVGENAALIYWSTETSLAVAPRTGFVHVRNSALLENNSRITVYATDQNGRGRNGTLDVVVKLLDRNQIAVMTVENAFLDDESAILNNLSNTIGYEIKVLRTVVISENTENYSRKKRDVASTPGATMQLYVYGLYESEPVDVVRLASDINNSNVEAVTVARVLSLEDHLEGLEICPAPGLDTGLLVATIVLAVLLLLLIIAIALWFILIRKYRLNFKRRNQQNYENFDNSNSSSRNNTMDPIPKVEIPPKPRLNIEELKRSERRLQEMLDIPIKTIEVENNINTVTDEPTIETIVDISDSIPQLPIVIQSIDKLKDNNDESDDEDEFGENKEKRRKSVVTFNENVEKIIHLDSYADSPEPNLEIYKF